MKLRRYRKEDLDSLYAISLATGAKGADASHLHRDGRLIGHIYSAPYAVLSPETCFVACDSEGVAGYIVGVLDTAAFEERLERDWWPGLRAAIPDPEGAAENWTADQRRSHMIHHPRRTPADVAEHYPAHVHMNLLPRAQGQGLGPALLEHWITSAQNYGTSGVHVGSNAQNSRAYGFWQSQGFEPLASRESSGAKGTVWLGRQLETAKLAGKLAR